MYHWLYQLSGIETSCILYLKWHWYFEKITSVRQINQYFWKWTSPGLSYLTNANHPMSFLSPILTVTVFFWKSWFKCALCQLIGQYLDLIPKIDTHLQTRTFEILISSRFHHKSGERLTFHCIMMLYKIEVDTRSVTWPAHWRAATFWT